MYLVINKCVTAVKVSNFSGHYLRNRSTLDIGVLGCIGIVQHKEYCPEVLSIPPGTPCIYGRVWGVADVHPEAWGRKLSVFRPVPCSDSQAWTSNCLLNFRKHPPVSYILILSSEWPFAFTAESHIGDAVMLRNVGRYVSSHSLVIMGRGEAEHMIFNLTF